MEYYRFSKPGFAQRQSVKLRDPKRRQAILIDCGLNHDPKMLALYGQKDVSLWGILFEIWSNLELETETWCVSRSHFTQWVRRTFSDSNRFDVDKRLQWLAHNGFISLQVMRESQDKATPPPANRPNTPWPTSGEGSFTSPSTPFNPSLNAPFNPPETLVPPDPPDPHDDFEEAAAAGVQPNGSQSPISNPQPQPSGAAAGWSDRLKLLLRDSQSGETQTESQWLSAGLAQKFASRLDKAGQTQPPWTLPALMANLPGARRIVEGWAQQQPPLRMAALAYCRERSGVVDELGYCLKAIEQQWEGVLALVPQAQAALDRGDYVIEI